jgi:hypothetical protein
MNQSQLQMIDYFERSTAFCVNKWVGDDCASIDDQRCRLTAKAKGLGRKVLAEVATIVIPETLFAWPKTDRPEV